MLLTLKETSEMLKLKENTLYAWVYQKKIPYVKIGGKLAFSLNKIQQFIAINSHDSIN